MKTAKASSIDEGVGESDEDGVLFGDSCDRRVFFPGSNKQNAAVAGDVHGAQQRAPATDPLYALGLFPSSPYTALRESAPGPGNAAQEDSTSNRARRSKSPKPRRAAVDALGRSACAPLEQPWTTAAATSCRGKRCPSPISGARHHDPRQVASYEEIYSPQKLRCRRGRFKSAADGNQERPTNSTAGEPFDDDESATFLLQKIRADEKAMAEEAARLRCEADASVMIRRFWRRSG